jgi:hypothetical protein
MTQPSPQFGLNPGIVWVSADGTQRDIKGTILNEIILMMIKVCWMLMEMRYGYSTSDYFQKNNINGGFYD